MQLLRVEEPENEKAGLGGVWIGAHPTIGEKLAQVTGIGIGGGGCPPCVPSLQPYASSLQP